MNIGTAFPSRFLKSTDADDADLTYTIRTVDMEEVGQGKDASDKPVLYFQEVDKGMVLNKTNAAVVTKLYGAETDDWIGKRVTIYSTEVQFGADMVPSLRIRSKAPAPRKPRTAAPQIQSDPQPEPEPVAATTDDGEDIPF